MFCQLVFTYGLIVMGGQGKFAYRSSGERLVGSLTGEGWGGVVRKGYALEFRGGAGRKFKGRGGEK